MASAVARYEARAGTVLAIQEEALTLTFAVGVDKTNRYEGGLGIVTVSGPLVHHTGSTWDSYDEIVARAEEAFKSDETKAVVFDIDSPGGDANGMDQTHNAIQRLKKKYRKPAYGYSNETMCSAAYGIGSACDEIWLPRTGKVGSIGVIGILEDRTIQNARAGVKVALITSGKRKADGQPDREFDPEVLAVATEHVQDLAATFFASVSSARDLHVRKVKALEAGVFYGTKAMKAGLADGVADWPVFLGIVRKAHGIKSPRNTLPKGKEQRDPTQETRLMSARTKLLTLIQSKNEALRSLAAATDDDEMELCALEVADITAKIAAAMPSKGKEKSKKAEDDGDGDDARASDDDDDDDKKDPDDDEDDKDCDKSKSKKSKASSKERTSDGKDKAKKAFVAPSQSLIAEVMRLTGAASESEALGKLAALSELSEISANTDARLEKLERNNKRQRVRDLLAEASAKGKIAPSEVEALTTKGVEDFAWLKGYIGGRKPQVRVRGEEFEERGSDGEGGEEGQEASDAPTIQSQLKALTSRGSSDTSKIMTAFFAGASKEELALVKEGVERAHKNEDAKQFKRGPRF